MIRIETLVVGQMKCNCYIVYDSDGGDAIIIDPGDDADYIVNKLSTLTKDPVKILSTHAHFDHNMAAYELQKGYNIPYLISEKDLYLLKKMPQSAKHYLNIKVVKVPKPDGFLQNNQKIYIGESFLKVIDMPGHTPGGVSFYNPHENIIFTGDTIFKDGGIGRYDFSYSSKNDHILSIDKILSLPPDTLIYPGHGDPTSVKNELLYHR